MKKIKWGKGKKNPYMPLQLNNKIFYINEKNNIIKNLENTL